MLFVLPPGLGQSCQIFQFAAQQCNRIHHRNASNLGHTVFRPALFPPGETKYRPHHIHSNTTKVLRYENGNLAILSRFTLRQVSVQRDRESIQKRRLHQQIHIFGNEGS